MAKNTGFAALAALQTKPEQLEETQIDDVDTGEDLGDVSEDQLTPAPVTTVAPAQPTFDDVAEDIPPATRLLNELPVAEWSTDELKAYIAGNVSEEVYQAALKAAIQEYRIREVDVSAAWSLDECRAYFAQGIVPAKTSKGAWVNDVTRAYRREHEWETNELESWALGEIKAEGVSHDGGLAIELKRRLNLNLPGVGVQEVITNYKHATGQTKQTLMQVRPDPVTPEVAETTIAEVSQKLKLEGLTEMNLSYIEASLAKFEAAMKPGRAINETIAGDSQKLLKEVISYSISIQDPLGARSAMQFLLEYFRARRGDGQLFEDTYAYRGIPDMRATEAQKLAHRDLLTLFLAYADPMVEIRAQTDIPSLIAGVPSHLQSRVLEFFCRQA